MQLILKLQCLVDLSSTRDRDGFAIAGSGLFFDVVFDFVVLDVVW